MVDTKAGIEKVKRVFRHNLWDCFITAVFFTWGFVLLMNNAQFAQTTDIFVPIRFFATVTSLVVAGAVIGRLSVPRLLGLSEPMARFLAILTAAFSCALAGVGAGMDMAAAGAFLAAALPTLSAVFASLAICLFSHASFVAFRDRENVELVLVTFLSLAMAVVIFTVLVALLRGVALLAVLTVMLLFGAITILRDYAGAKTGAGALSLAAASGTDTSAIGDQTDGASPARGLSIWRTANVLPVIALLFASGFFLAFEFNVTQKTLHFPGILVSTVSIGDTAMNALFYLLLLVALMGFVLLECVRPSIPVIGLVVALLLAATFFSLPYLTMLNFILTTAIVTTLFFITLLLLFEVLRTIDSDTGALRFFSTGIMLLALGGLGGTGLASVILMCSDTLPYYDELFRFLPALFILIIIIVLLLSFRNIAALVKRHTFEKELDTSKLEDRCHIVAKRHGLTKREGEVLTLLAMGRNVPGIAETLLISAATVKTHVLHIYRKIGVSSRQELLNVMYDEGGDKWAAQPYQTPRKKWPEV